MGNPNVRPLYDVNVPTMPKASKVEFGLLISGS